MGTNSSSHTFPGVPHRPARPSLAGLLPAYETADGLALDIQRYLAGEAVAAVPPSMRYRFSKFFRKNRGPVLAAMIILFVLLIGIAGTTWGMIDADNARLGEETQRKKVEDQRDSVVKAHQRADEALLASRKISASLALDKGLALCAKGDVAPGVLWLVRALELTPPEAPDLERAIRINLADWRHELHPLRYVLEHPETTFTMDLAPDNVTLATGCGDKRVRVWDLRTGKLRYPPLHHPESLTQVKFSPDGRWLATSDYGGNTRIWDVTNGKQQSPNLQVEEIADGLAFSPDSSILAVLDAYRNLRLWKTSSGELIGKPIQVSGPRAMNLAFRPDGKVLVVANRSANARIVDVAEQKVIRDLPHEGGSIENVAFSADGKYCVTVGTKPSGRLWDAATFKELPVTLTHQGIVYRALFSPDGKRLATSSQDQTVRLWDTATGQPIGSPMPNEGGIAWLSFSADSSKLFTGCSDAAQLWGAATAKPIGGRLHQDGTNNGVAITADAKLLIAVGWDGNVKIWDNALPERKVQVLTGLNGALQALEFSPDGRLLAAGDFGTCVNLWNTATGQPIGERQGEGRAVWSVAFSPEGKFLLSGTDNTKAQLWDAKKFARIGDPIKHTGSVDKVLFHPKGDRFFTSSGKSNTIQSWDVATQKKLVTCFPTAPSSTISTSIHAAIFCWSAIVMALDCSTSRAEAHRRSCARQRRVACWIQRQ